MNYNTPLTIGELAADLADTIDALDSAGSLLRDLVRDGSSELPRSLPNSLRSLANDTSALRRRTHALLVQARALPSQESDMTTNARSADHVAALAAASSAERTLT